MKKKIVSLLFLLSGAGISFAQDTVKSSIPRQVFTATEHAPEFPGGTGALHTFLAKNIHYPKSAYTQDVQGRVVAQFIVEPDGSLTDIRIKHSLTPDCDKETLRVISKMPLWNPGRQNGAFVAVYYTLPVTFKLQ
jgi:periplasmic protein TonB